MDSQSSELEQEEIEIDQEFESPENIIQTSDEIASNEVSAPDSADFDVAEDEEIKNLEVIGDEGGGDGEDGGDEGYECVPEIVWKSKTLMKTTKTRQCDMRELQERKGRIKPEDDIWWSLRSSGNDCVNQRPRRYSDVGSRLNRSTTAYEKWRRPKALHTDHRSSMLFINQDCELMPPNLNKEEKSKKTRPISSESPLLKPTMESLQAGWHGSSSRLSIERSPDSYVTRPIMLTRVKGTGPKQVASKLAEDTASLAANRWKSKEEWKIEEAALQAAKRDAAHKVKKTSAKLLLSNAAMIARKVSKTKKIDHDPREAGWNVFNVTTCTIPDVDLGVPLRKLREERNSFGGGEVEVVVGEHVDANFSGLETETSKYDE